ncbi:MAG: glycosyltransferase family 4 protein [Phycisphaerales bacterium]|nr:MAG: glycosyltransferase family 4 protein [Phycisphaerales bacterium]
MLTGRFDSNNWILAFLAPLSASKECACLYMVSTNPVPELPNVVPIYPPKWLTKIVGASSARLMTFAWAALRKRPHVIGGFHLLFNGITAALMARLTRARSMYFCVGGMAELSDGGIHAENNITIRMETPDRVVEERLIRTVSEFDTIVTMGTRAVKSFQERNVNADFHVVAGAIDSARFHPSAEEPSYDVVLTGRLAPVKRVDVFLEAAKHVVDRINDVRVLIVGDGPLRRELEQQSHDLGIERNVRFGGYLTDDEVVARLRSSKIFVLTSDSEGLSLAMTEAMMCGLPAVVSNVGDLGDLVEDGVNGYLVPRRCPEAFANRLVELLSDPVKLEAFSQAARRTAMRHETQATIHRWDSILASFNRSASNG